MLEHVPPAVKLALDAVAATVTFAAVLQFLPIVAAGLTIAWHLTRFYDRRQAQKQGKPYDG